MDKNILKKFAMESRTELMKKVRNKLKILYIDENFNENKQGELVNLVSDKHSLSLSKIEFEHRSKLIDRIKNYSDNGEIDEQGINGVVEEVAYTWFNRIIAIRYMEVNDITPISKDNQSLGFRILSSKDNQVDPEILKYTNLANPNLDINYDKEKYLNQDDDNKKFNILLIAVCKKLGRVIPDVFDGQTDYIDILIPDNMLNKTGFVTKVIREIPEEYWKEQVEIIGWLYQYWNVDSFNRIYDGDMSNRRISTKDIPAATQLFTPDWVVKYMVENSLGKYWIEHGGDKKLIDNWKYYIKGNEDNNQLKVKDINNMTVKEVNETLVSKISKISPTSIKCIDPCSGSGHILVYMFDVLYQIYKSEGYLSSDIPELILKNNLYGLDIDDRAGQLSILSVLLKAKNYDKDIFNKDIIKNLNIMAIQDSKSLSRIVKGIKDLIEQDNVQDLIDTFKDAKEIGSLLIIESKDYEKILNKVEKNFNPILDNDLLQEVKPLVKETKILSDKYDVVVTNPPYMNKSKMPNKLVNYCIKNLNIAKNDLATAFYYDYLKNKLNNNGYLSMITTNSWMYIKTFKDLREEVLEKYNFDTIVDFGTELFEGKIGHLSIVSWVNKKIRKKDNVIVAIKLNKFNYSQRNKKQQEFYNKENWYRIEQENLLELPGVPFAYWVSEALRKDFANNLSLSSVCKPVQGLATGDNNRFTKFWPEVNIKYIKFDCKSSEEATNSKCKWFPYNKGGNARKWYGNNEYIVNWENDGLEIKNFTDEKGKLRSRPQNLNYYFRESITWSLISNNITFRYKDYGQIFDVAGMSFFPNDNILNYLLGLCNSKVVNSIIQIIAPTLNFQVRRCFENTNNI